MKPHTPATPFVKAMRAGRRWAAMHRDAEPETYRAKHTAMVKAKGATIADWWLRGVMNEYWTATLDEHGRQLPGYVP
jgi:hypothetical protein